MSITVLERRRLASIIGGKVMTDGYPRAMRHYRLGVAPAPDADIYIVRLIEAVPGIGMTFEATSFEPSFERAIVIGEDLAESAGHLADGVVVSVEEFHSITAIGLDAG